MNIRTFAAGNAQEAMAKVRAEMGPDAVIIALDETPKGGVVVRAAVDAASESLAADTESDGGEVSPCIFEDRLNELLQARLRTPSAISRSSSKDSAIAQALAYNRLPENIATALTQAAATSRHSEAENALADALNRYVDMTPLAERPHRPIMLVGAPGAGKTSVAARLAQRAVASGAKPLLISLDGDKAGARTQIETYAAHLNFDALIVDDIAGARAALAKYQDGPVFIDTVGTSPFDIPALSALRNTIAFLAADAVAVMPAGLDAEEAAEAAALFAKAGVKHFVCTRLDTTRRLGSLVAAATSGLGLAQTTCSALIGTGLDAPDALSFARRLLSGGTSFSHAHAA